MVIGNFSLLDRTYTVPKISFLAITAALLISNSVRAESSLICATGDPKGVYYSLGSKIASSAAKAHLPITLLPTGGSYHNLVLLAQGKVQLCIAQGDIVQDALMGKGRFSRPLSGISAIALLHTEVVHIFVRTPLHLTHISEFRGKRVCAGPKGSGTESNARLILETAGISTQELDFINLDVQESIARLADDRIDVLFFTSGYPAATARIILNERQGTLFELPPELLERLVDENPCFRLTYIPSGTYPAQYESVAAIGVPALLLAGDTVDPQLIYSVTSALFSTGDFDPALSHESLGAPLNPGAARFYESLGYLHHSSLAKRLGIWLFLVLVLILIVVLALRYRLAQRLFRMKDIPRVAFTLLVLFVVGFIVMYYAERHVNDYYGTPLMAAWSTLLNWVNFGAKEPVTLAGRVTSVTMTMLGFGGLVWLMAETASVFIQRRLLRGHHMHENHYVIINWNKKGPGIIEQLQHPELPPREILVLTTRNAGQSHAIPDRDRLTHRAADMLTEGFLKAASINRAHSVMILADEFVNEGSAMDAENVLLLLSVRRLCTGEKAIPIVVELLDPRRADLASCAGLLEDGQVEVVSTQRIGQNLLAQVAVTPGLTKIYDDLLTFGAKSNEIYSAPLPKHLYGMSIDRVCMAIVKLRERKLEIMPMAISREGRILLNPSSAKHGCIRQGDLLYAMCDRRSDLKALDDLQL